MSSRSRRQFQRVALVVIGCLLVLIGGRQLAHAASSTFGDRCDRDGKRYGHYIEDVRIHDHGTRHERRIRVIHDDVDVRIIRD